MHRSHLGQPLIKNHFLSSYCRATMYAYTKFAPTDRDFDFLECLLFGALISATDPGKFLARTVRCDVYI